MIQLCLVLLQPSTLLNAHAIMALQQLLHGQGDLYSAQVWTTYTFHTIWSFYEHLSDHGASPVLKLQHVHFLFLRHTDLE